MRLPLLMILLLVSTLPAQAAGESAEYLAHYPHAGATHIKITIRPEVPLLAPQPFVFPRAIPMGYGEQPYDRFVENLRAFDEKDGVLHSQRLEGPKWIIGTLGARISRLEYEVNLQAMELMVLSAADSSKVRKGYVGVLGYSVFGFFESLRNSSIRLRLKVPPDWPVFSTLAPQVPVPGAEFETTARDFYTLADSQFLMGPAFSVRRLESAFPLFLAVYDEGESDVDRLSALAQEAFEAVDAYFGSAPFRHYTLHQELLKPVTDRHEYGFSMEHLESGTFYLAHDQGITRLSTSVDTDRIRYNFAHHIAHAWIPKRSYGEGYYPFDWEKAPLIDTIWFSEGFAQYAAIEALADRMPQNQAASYRFRMVQTRFQANLDEAPDFIRALPLVELSRLASTRYSEDFRIGRNIFSRGGMMAAEMDGKIRQESAGKHRLRDALRRLITWSARSGRGFRIAELPRIFAEVTGVDTSDILEKWLAEP